MGKFNRFLLSILLIFFIVLAGTFVYENLYDIRYEETISDLTNGHTLSSEYNDYILYGADVLYIYRRFDRWTGEIKIAINGLYDDGWHTSYGTVVPNK